MSVPEDRRRVRLPGGETVELSRTEVQRALELQKARVRAVAEGRTPGMVRMKLHPDEPGNREAVEWAGVPAYTRPAVPRLHVPTGKGPGKRRVPIDLADARTVRELVLARDKARRDLERDKARSSLPPRARLTLARIASASRGDDGRARFSAAELRRALPGAAGAVFRRTGVIARS